MSSETNLEIGKFSKFPTIYIPGFAELFAGFRTDLIESLPAPGDAANADALRFLELWYRLAEEILNFMDAVQEDFVLFTKEDDVWERAFTNIKRKTWDIIIIVNIIYDDMEKMIFGRVMDENTKLEHDAIARTDIGLNGQLIELVWRSIVIDACLNGTSIEVQLSEAAALPATAPGLIQKLLELDFEDESAADFVLNVLEYMAAQKAQESQKPAAQILLFNGRPNA